MGDSRDPGTFGPGHGSTSLHIATHNSLTGTLQCVSA